MCINRQLAAVLGFALAIFGSRAFAGADPLTDNLGPREIGMGDAARGDAKGAQATVLNPSGLSLSRELVFEGGYGYRSSDGASIASVAACDSTVPVPGCFYYRYFKVTTSAGGVDISRRSHELGSVVSRMLTPNVSVGVNGKYFDYNSELDGESDTSGWAMDAGLSLRASSVISIGVAGYNVVAKDTPRYPRGVGGGISLRPGQALSIALDGLWSLEKGSDSSGRYGGGAEYFLRSGDMQAGYPIRLGGVFDAAQDIGYVSAGIGYATQKVGIDIGLRKQVSGTTVDGSELMILASLRVFGPRMTAQPTLAF